MGLWWNSHHFLESFFIFPLFFFACNFYRLSWVIPPWICPLFCSLEVPLSCFEFVDPKSHFFGLKLCLILKTYRYAIPSKEMFRNFIYAWMYLCIKPRYWSAKCFLESLIANFMHRVWKIMWTLTLLVPNKCSWITSQKESQEGANENSEDSSLGLCS